MARQLRIEFPGSTWHVTSRGNEQRDIVDDDTDRVFFLDLLGQAVERFHWILYQYVLMTNHYHFVVELTEESLGRGMKWLNSRYAQAFNRTRQRVGHLFQGRYDARLVEKESYLLEVLRYDVLNPVRANIVSRPEDYLWSGHRAMAGLCAAPKWLSIDRVLGWFAPEKKAARALYMSFIHAGIGARSPWNDLVGQIYLGTNGWVEEIRDKVESRPRVDEYPMAQKIAIERTMADVIASVASALPATEHDIRNGRGGDARMLTVWLACYEARLDLRSIAAALRLRSLGRVSTLIRSCESRLRLDRDLQASADRCVATLRGV